MTEIEKFLREKNLTKEGYKEFIITGDFGTVNLNDLIEEFVKTQQHEIDRLRVIEIREIERIEKMQ